MLTFSHPILITGSDTGIGKTHCALAVIAALQARGLRVAAMKPVASGCEQTPHGLHNDDALALQAQAGLDMPYEIVNPYTFEPPVSPHLAAEEAGVEVDLQVIYDAYTQLRAHSDIVVVEGAGGWRVPLNHTHSFKDLALALEAQVVLVVGVRLGCINHARLSAECMFHDRVSFSGWIANAIDPEFDGRGSVATLLHHLPGPLLGELPYAPDEPAAAQAGYLRL